MFVPLIVILFAAVMIAVEVWQPGRRWPRVANWWLRVALLNSTQAAMVWLAGVAWEGWMRTHRPWSADQFGLIGGAFIGYFVITFVYYWWHRWRHEVGFLWRWFHQVHHSPQRIEIITSFYKHPLELVANSLLISTILYLLVGLNPQAATGALLISAIAELFYHWNVNTPYWLGFIIQRPESHCVHHQAGAHSYNYADLPLWDLLFGTFKNPREWKAECGFGNDEYRLIEMLRGVDVTAQSATEVKS